MDPKDVGLHQSELVLGKHSGRHAFEKKLVELGFELGPEELSKAFRRFKDMADKKKEISDPDIESIVADEIYVTPEMYHLEYMHVVSGGSTVPSATIRIRKGDEVVERAGIGVGSVDCVYRTIDSIIDVPHKLTDYSVKAVTGGTDALGEVTVRLEAEGGMLFLGRGSSMDIIEASAKAYMQAINKLVYHLGDRPQHTNDTP
jgi:2-isopropylmalate synthase